MLISIPQSVIPPPPGLLITPELQAYRERWERYPFKKFFKVAAVDEQSHTVYGLATEEVPDKDEEVCIYADTAPYFVSWSREFMLATSASGADISLGCVRLMHGLTIAGKVVRIDFKPEQKQIWTLVSPANAEMWGLIAGGYVTGFSQGGTYIYRRCAVCDTDKPSGKFCPKCQKNTLTNYAAAISELSIVDNPCLGTAHFSEIKRMLANAEFAYTDSAGSMSVRKFHVDPESPAPADKSAPRAPAGQFSPQHTGPDNDLLESYGYHHVRTGSNTQHGSTEPVEMLTYTHADDKSQVRIHQDSKWEYDNGKGQTQTGLGINTLAECLARTRSKKADWTPAQAKSWFDANNFVLLEESETHGGRRYLVLRTEDPQVKAALVPAAAPEPVAQRSKPVTKKKPRVVVKGDWDTLTVECPNCGEEIDLAPDQDSSAPITCPECGTTFTLDDLDDSDKAVVVMRASIASMRKASGDARTKRVDGEDLPATAFLIVLDPDDTGTWNLPVEFSTDEKSASHVRNALSRFNQLKDVPDDVKSAAWKRLVSLCHKYNIEVADESQPGKSAAAEMRKQRQAFFARISESPLTVLKGMDHISAMAQLLQNIKWLQSAVEFEGTIEDDDRDHAIAADLMAWLTTGVDILKDVVDEETSELTAATKAVAAYFETAVQ